MARAFAPWQSPGARIGKYAVAIAYRFHFDPRVTDEWTVAEFDRFAAQCDAMDQAEREQERQARTRAPSTRRR